MRLWVRLWNGGRPREGGDTPLGFQCEQMVQLMPCGSEHS